MPTLVLDEAPLPADASIRNFQQGRAGYVADAVEQALLPEDMADLRSMRKHEVFLSLKRDLALVSSLTTLSLSLLLFFILILIFIFSNLHISFFSLKGYLIRTQGQGNSKHIP